MTLVEFIMRNSRINITNNPHKPRWTLQRNRSSAGRRQISTQKLVVSDVSAESALLNEAATIPMVKSTTTAVPKFPVAANIGSSSSPDAGSGMPWRPANITSSTPSERNSRLVGRKAKP